MKILAKQSATWNSDLTEIPSVCLLFFYNILQDLILHLNLCIEPLMLTERRFCRKGSSNMINHRCLEVRSCPQHDTSWVNTLSKYILIFKHLWDICYDYNTGFQNFLHIWKKILFTIVYWDLIPGRQAMVGPFFVTGFSATTHDNLVYCINTWDSISGLLLIHFMFTALVKFIMVNGRNFS
jgi:hypothetical protein